MITSRILIVLLLCHTLNSELLDVSKCRKWVKRGDGVVCYNTQPLSYNFEGVKSFCEGQSAQTATVRSEEENEALVEIMNENYINSVWIGMNQTPTFWSSSDGTLLLDQGCFATSILSNYLSEQGSYTSNSIEYCSNICKEKNFHLAALSGTKCACSLNFPVSLQSQDSCNTPCPNDINQNCGGSDSYKVIAVKGTYSNWMKGRPSSGPDRRKHLCSIMVVDPINNSLNTPSLATTSWMDVTCETKFKTICEIELSKDFPTCDTTVQNIYSVQYNTSQLTQASKCIYVDSEPKNFFSATETCAMYNGKIIDINDKKLEEKLGNLLNRETVQEFWTGAKKFKQNWEDGSMVTYSKWGLQKELEFTCGSVSRNNLENFWILDDCNQEKDVICETSNNTHLNKESFFKSTTVSTTNLPLTKITNPILSTTLPPINVTVSDLSASRSTNIGMYIGIAIGVAVLLLIILAIIIIIYILKKKHKLPVIKGGLEAKRSIFVEPTYFFGANEESPANVDISNYDTGHCNTDTMAYNSDMGNFNGDSNTSSSNGACGGFD